MARDVLPSRVVSVRSAARHRQREVSNFIAFSSDSNRLDWMVGLYLPCALPPGVELNVSIPCHKGGPPWM
jgi:hypothetical protein